MSDRCSLTITLRKDDVPKLARAMHGTEAEVQTGRLSGVMMEEAEDGAVALHIEEANYGLYTERQDLAKLGVAYYGGHGAGGDYGPAAFAGADGQWADVAVSPDGTVMLPADRLGRASRHDRDEVQLYGRLLKRAKALIHPRAERKERKP